MPASARSSANTGVRGPWGRLSSDPTEGDSAQEAPCPEPGNTASHTPCPSPEGSPSVPLVPNTRRDADSRRPLGKAPPTMAPAAARPSCWSLGAHLSSLCGHGPPAALWGLVSEDTAPARGTGHPDPHGAWAGGLPSSTANLMPAGPQGTDPWGGSPPHPGGRGGGLSGGLTSPVHLAQIREPPEVAQAHGEAHTAQQVLELVVPGWPRLPATLRGWSGPWGACHACHGPEPLPRWEATSLLPRGRAFSQFKGKPVEPVNW